MIKFAFVFRRPPHGSAISREGMDALLAATAFCNENELAVFFIDDGVLNLLSDQKPELILQKNFSNMFKLLDLCDIEQRYICEQSLQQFELSEQDLIISCHQINRTLLVDKLQKAKKIITF